MITIDSMDDTDAAAENFPTDEFKYIKSYAKVWYSPPQVFISKVAQNH